MRKREREILDLIKEHGPNVRVNHIWDKIEPNIFDKIRGKIFGVRPEAGIASVYTSLNKLIKRGLVKQDTIRSNEGEVYINFLVFSVVEDG